MEESRSGGGEGEERSREEEEGSRGRKYGLKSGEAGILGEREIEERWGREGIEGRRAKRRAGEEESGGRVGARGARSIT